MLESYCMKLIHPHSLVIAAFVSFSFIHAQQPTAPASMEHHARKSAVPSTSLDLTGNGKTIAFSLAELRAMPQHSVTVRNGHSKQNEIYTGVSVADLLEKLGVSAQSTARKQVLHSYVRAEGTDHYFVIFSAAELEPSLREGDAIVALTQDGKPLAEDGELKLVTSGEKVPSRWVRNLDALTVVTVE
jgi:hypothetical protein